VPTAKANSLDERTPEGYLVKMVTGNEAFILFLTIIPTAMGRMAYG